MIFYKFNIMLERKKCKKGIKFKQQNLRTKNIQKKHFTVICNHHANIYYKYYTMENIKTYSSFNLSMKKL